MPRLIVQKKISAKDLAAQYTVPTSPFQKLVDGAMRRRKLSGRRLAELMTQAGAKTSQSTVWTWLHHINGAPGRRSFKPRHAQALAEALDIKLADLHAAHDASLHRYTSKENAAPAATHDALAFIEETIKSGDSRYVKRSWVLHLVQAARRGCQ